MHARITGTSVVGVKSIQYPSSHGEDNDVASVDEDARNWEAGRQNTVSPSLSELTEGCLTHPVDLNELAQSLPDSGLSDMSCCATLGGEGGYNVILTSVSPVGGVQPQHGAASEVFGPPQAKLCLVTR
jgi:hypothetical protein